MLKKTLLAAVALGLAATAVQANDISGYATYSVGHGIASKPKAAKEVQSFYKEFGGSTTTDRASAGHKIVVGLNVHPYIALEAQYTNLGKTNYKGSFADNDGAGNSIGFSDKLNLKTSGFGGNVVGKYPIQDFTVFAKAGYHLMRTKGTFKENGAVSFAGFSDSFSNSNSKTVSKWAPSVGIGAAYDMTPELSVVAEYERYQGLANKKVNIDGDKLSFKHNVDFTSVGLRYTF
ncbi:MAG: outer membrane beta-barrel protein [Pseudomonas sp.]|nr:outer membrane beta-barrel protein [Pseudomonas sp.]